MATQSVHTSGPFSGINFTPLLDVVLTLLAAFAVTLPLLVGSLKINLPEITAPRIQEVPKSSASFTGVQSESLPDQKTAVITEAEPEPRKTPARRQLQSKSKQETAYNAPVQARAAIDRIELSRLDLALP